MQEDNFIEEYINSCVTLGVVSPKKICEKVLEELDIINKELATSNDLRIKRKNLINILKSFEHESVQKFKKTNNILNESIDSDNPSYKEYLINICSFIEKKEKNVSKREIMDHVGGLEQNQIVYMAIKWLCDRGILITNEDRTLSKGENWNLRIIPDISEAV